MQQWPYAKEPFDSKLFLIRFLKKLWLVVCAALISAMLVGGGYYLKKVVFGGPQEYEITTTYFVEYTTFMEETGEIYNYTNAATWESWVTSDWFVDRAWEHALEAGMVPEMYGVEKSDLPKFFYATLLTDLRIPSSTVTTPYEELTVILNQSLQRVFFDFATERDEMSQISIVDETDLAVADKDIRTLRAVILGAVIGAFVGGFGLALWIIWDDSVVVPETFAYRYGLPITGFCGKDAHELSGEALTNIKYLFGEKKENGLVVVGRGIDADKIQKILPEGMFRECLVAGKLSEAEFEKLRNAGGVLLLIEAGTCSGKEIEHVLQTLKQQDCAVVGGLLCNADSRLIQLYRFGCKKQHV